MKRLVWLLITAVCTALAQVQPVDSPVKRVEAGCCCCDQPGACGMPDCAPAPAAPGAFQAMPAAALQRTAARRLAPAPATRFDGFLARFDSRPASIPARASHPGAPAAGVPLFKAHCSFLI